MSNYIKQLQERRSIYALGQNVSLTQNQIENLIKEAVKASPSAFNSQSSRVVILFGQAKDQFWNEITLGALEKVTPAEAFEATKAKIASFAAGIGTVLFFEDQDVVKGLQEQFPLYADNFPIWSEHSTGIAQHSVWTALANENIGASLQHYNPLVDQGVAEVFNIPSSWILRAQMPFGSIEAPAGEKTYMDDSQRFMSFGQI
ncbi:nitroreductase family protein [Vaginisenegalia massiliensis]|uniref:nitroreductase family protein n=1 Tax=Vaginisenegalia massiliensis TaxID=2058294 RepID=UPI000F541F28|nr:nitroreductase family protein [Vaginisenegalia massiliensis]